MARHVHATRELHLGRRDLLDASTVKNSLNALPGFKTSAGELHVHLFHYTYIYIFFLHFANFCVLCEEGQTTNSSTSFVSYFRGLHLHHLYISERILGLATV
jgi:hypothetical protein